MIHFIETVTLKTPNPDGSHNVIGRIRGHEWTTAGKLMPQLKVFVQNQPKSLAFKLIEARKLYRRTK